VSECLGRWHSLQTLRQQSGALMLQVGKGEWSSLSQSPPWAVDAWGLGCLLQVLACQSSLLSPLYPTRHPTQRRKGAAVQQSACVRLGQNTEGEVQRRTLGNPLTKS